MNRRIPADNREPMSVERIQQQFRDSAALTQEALDTLFGVLANGSKILVCGNGGSAADAQRFASYLIGCFERGRPGLPAIALTTDTSILTAIGNEFAFEQIFSIRCARSGSRATCCSRSARRAIR